MAIISSLPFTLVNGQTADATQVMADFNTIVSGVNSGAAASGANADITSLSALSTPLSIAQGGTGASTLAGAGIVTGPANATASNVPTYADATGKKIGAGLGVGTAANNLVQLNASAQLPAVDGSLLINIPNRGYIAGLTLSNDSITPTTVLDISSGAAAAGATPFQVMVLASAYTKTLASWAVGTGNGALDTGVIAAATWYHVFLIERTDTGVTDILFSKNVNAPTMPANYTLFRRVGSFLTDGAAHITAFSQNGDDFLWVAPVLDVNVNNPGGSAVTHVMTVPTGVVVQANVLWTLRNTGVGASPVGIISALVANDVAPSATSGNNLGLAFNGGGGTAVFSAQIVTRTDTTGALRSRLNTSDGSVSLYGLTIGWIDSRGKYN